MPPYECLFSQLLALSSVKISYGNHYLWDLWHFMFCMLSRFSRVQLCATLWTVACHTPLSMGICRVGSKPKCPFKSHTKRRYMEKRRRSCESGDRERSKRSHKPGNTWSHQKLEEARKDSPRDAQEGVQPCQHLDIGLLAPRTVKE